MYCLPHFTHSVKYMMWRISHVIKGGFGKFVHLCSLTVWWHVKLIIFYVIWDNRCICQIYSADFWFLSGGGNILWLVEYFIFC